MSEQKQNRKSYLIKPDFQWKMIGYAAVLSALILVLVYGAHTYFIYSLKMLGSEAGLDSGHVFFRFVDEQSGILNSIFLMIAVGINLLVVFGGLWLSNRIAGPIYRVESSFLEYNEKGQTAKVKFRQHDFFPELMTAFNQFLEKQETRSSQSSDQNT